MSYTPGARNPHAVTAWRYGDVPASASADNDTYSGGGEDDD